MLFNFSVTLKNVKLHWFQFLNQLRFGWLLIDIARSINLHTELLEFLRAKAATAFSAS